MWTLHSTISTGFYESSSDSIHPDSRKGGRGLPPKGMSSKICSQLQSRWKGLDFRKEGLLSLLIFPPTLLHFLPPFLKIELWLPTEGQHCCESQGYHVPQSVGLPPYKPDSRTSNNSQVGKTPTVMRTLQRTTKGRCVRWCLDARG